MIKVFIDGSAGTTGLRIVERLQDRKDVELISVSEEQRKDPAIRAEKINQSDITFLCLPDAAAKEAVAMVENPNTKIIDASTAHRTAPGWTYGFPELSPEMRKALEQSKRTANPGCHASGFIALVYPLVKAGILPADYPIAAHSITGYSGGGKKMIAEYEDEGRSILLDSPRQYGLTQKHKHLPEMSAVCGLSHPPIFMPIVSDFYSGMVVTVPVYGDGLNGHYTVKDLWEVYAEHYKGQKLVRMADPSAADGFLAGNSLSGKDYMELLVTGNDDRILLCSRFDNLGKGASGAAIQCMNIMSGIDETTGLVVD